MTEPKRQAPHPEWVQMYRQGVTSSKIAEGAVVPAGTVRYHLHIAFQAEPGIRDEHKAALGSVTRSPGLRNMNGITALYQAEGRLPGAGRPQERAMGVWLHRRRQEAAQGTLSPIYKEGLSVIPGWDKPSGRKADDEARWERRPIELIGYLAAGNDWPRHKKADTEQERVLGVWLHVQRMKHRRGLLDQGKENQLNTIAPGWRSRRARGRKQQPVLRSRKMSVTRVGVRDTRAL